MAARVCPHCHTAISAADAAAYSDAIECPRCKKRLEVAPGSRGLASIAGLAAGALAWRLSSGSGGGLGGVLPTVYAVLAFGVVTPLVLMLAANLRNAPTAPTQESVPASGGHGGHH